MNKIYLGLLVLVFLSGVNNVTAQPVMGADLTWTCVGQDSFLIKFIVYRDCNEIAFSSTPINFKCATSGTYITSLYINASSSTDITPICNSTCTRCQSMSCSFPYGFQKYSMQGIVRLNGAGSCCSIIMYWNSWPRNWGITTGSAGGQLYCESKINRCQNPCDNLPTFTNQPVFLLCVGQDFAFNHGAIDIDTNSTGGLADSLTYEWAEPLQGSNNPISYTYPYSYDKPIYFYDFPNVTQALPKGLHLDPHTGDIQFRPMRAQVTVMVLKVNEFRNGTKIGEIKRDMEVIVISCTSNNPPSVSTTNNVRTKYVCLGDTVKFDFTTSDANPTDSVTISWNNAIPGANWSHNNGQTKHPAASFSWVPSTSQLGSLPYNFSVTAKDNACPLNSQFTQSYQIFVNPEPLASITISDSGCGKYYFKANRISGVSPTYKWSSDSFTFSPDTGPLVSHSFSSGNYPIKLAMTTPGCTRSFYDTAFISPFMSVSLPADTTVCKNSTISIHAQVSNATGPYSLQWGSGKTTFSGDTNLTKQITITKDTSIWIRARYGAFSCPFDEIKIKVHKNKISLPEDTFFCDFNHAITPKFSPDKATFSTFRWYRDALPTVVDNDADLNVFDTGLFSCVATDTFGCSSTDMVSIHLNPSVIASAPDTLICSGTRVSINADVVANHNYSYKWWLKDTLLSSSRQLTVRPKDTTQYTLVATELLHGISCSASYKITVYTKVLPVITFEKFDVSCAKGNQIMLDSFVKVNGKRVFDGTWFCPEEPSQVGANIFFSQTAYVNFNPGYKLAYSYFDIGSGCLNTEFAYLKVYPKPGIPQITVTGDTSFCYGGSVSLAASATAVHYKWTTGDTMMQTTITKTGNYKLSVANAYGCYSDHSKAVNVIVFPKPLKPSISLSVADSFLVCNMTSGYFEWYYRPDTFSSYTYINNNSGAINPKLYCNKCYFSVMYSDTNDCESDTSYSYYFQVNSIDQINQNQAILIYPNPAHNKLFIENPTLKTTSFILSNILGNTILQTKIIPGKNEISLTNYKPGIYFIFMDGVIEGKLLIE